MNTAPVLVVFPSGRRAFVPAHLAERIVIKSGGRIGLSLLCI